MKKNTVQYKQKTLDNSFDNDIIPSTLYKYREWIDQDNKLNIFSHKLLMQNEFYFPLAEQLNDPFELQVPIRFDQLPSPNTPPENLDEKIRNHYGIFSMSKCPKILSQWTHYANNHAGICIGFSRDGIKDWYQSSAFPKNNNRSNLFCLPVTYHREFPSITPSSRYEYTAAILNVLTVKSTDWENEKEVRLMYAKENLSNDDKTISFPPEIITEVILGKNMHQEHQECLIDLLKQELGHVKILKADTSKTILKLDFTEVD